jgi:thymidine kinase
MFSGKTSELMRLVKRFSIAERECLVLNFSADNRYSTEAVISTHDHQHFKALKV